MRLGYAADEKRRMRKQMKDALTHLRDAIHEWEDVSDKIRPGGEILEMLERAETAISRVMSALHEPGA